MSSHFANDAAMDFVSQLVQNTIGQIEAAMANGELLEPDEYAGAALPAMIEVLTSLATLSGTADTPESEVIQRWQATYLSVWDRFYSEPQDAVRRQQLERTFAALLAESERIHAD